MAGGLLADHGRDIHHQIARANNAGECLLAIAVTYWPAHEAAIKPLIESLSFIRSKQHWGAAFRYGVVRVPAEDFARIAAAMGVAAQHAAAFPEALADST